MDGKTCARLSMRAATASDHDRVDSAFGRFDLGDRQKYSAFLRAQARAFLPVEAGIDRARPEALLFDWPQRRRSQLLTADLASLGIKVELSFDVPSFHSVEAALGAIYVLEGSRLGARLLAPRVPENLPRSFLTASGAAQWRTLTDVLDATLVSEAQVEAAIEAARAVFSLFAASALLIEEAFGTPPPTLIAS